MSSDHLITDEAQLTSILGEPSDLGRQKISTSLNEAMLEYIRRSPLVFYSTVDANGLIDVSPKGDAPGFVHVDEDGNHDRFAAAAEEADRARAEVIEQQFDQRRMALVDGQMGLQPGHRRFARQRASFCSR